MTPEEIIQFDAKDRELDHEPIIKTIRKWIADDEAFVLHENDSVLLAKMIDAKDVELHLFTADKPMTLVKSVIKFIERIRRTKIEYVYGKADEDHIIELLKMLGIPIMESDKEQYNWKAKVE
jgi:hypothetical protein